MRPYVAPLTQEPGAGRAQAEKMVRTLQGSAARHGELLEGLSAAVKRVRDAADRSPAS